MQQQSKQDFTPFVSECHMCTYTVSSRQQFMKHISSRGLFSFGGFNNIFVCAYTLSKFVNVQLLYSPIDDQIFSSLQLATDFVAFLSENKKYTKKINLTRDKEKIRFNSL